MFVILTCSFFDDPNDVDFWDVEEKISRLFKTKGEAVDAIHQNFEQVNEKPVDGIFTGNCKDADLGYWQVAKISEINTSDRVPTDMWAF
jgi:hypothetical protein|tara:strand:- start:370 stop:636 length:267 start_codon:yes stop_codon:yes gene_type:complete